MTSENLVTVPVGTTLDQAIEQFKIHKIEKLLVVDDDFKLRGLITIKDITKMIEFPNACKDELGRLRVGAAVGVAKDTDERVEALVEAQVDIICIDTAHGHSQGVLDAIAAHPRGVSRHPAHGRQRGHRRRAPRPSSSGASTASRWASDRAPSAPPAWSPAAACRRSPPSPTAPPRPTSTASRSSPTAASATPGDMVKALAAGAHSVMIGSLFAGTTESPGERILWEGRSYKVYRAMGSVGAMSEGQRRPLLPGRPEEAGARGHRGHGAAQGPALADVVFQLVGGLRAGMGYTGSATIEELHKKARASCASPRPAWPRATRTTCRSPRKRPTTSGR